MADMTDNPQEDIGDETTEMDAATALLLGIFITPETRRLRSGWRLAIHTFLVILITIFFSSIVAVLAAAFGWIQLIPGEAPPPSPLFMIGPLIGITAGTFVARRLLDRRTFISLGFNWDAHAARDLIFGILMPGGLFALIFLFEWAMGWLQPEASALHTESAGSVINGVAGVALLYLIVGYQEELLSRGYQLQNLVEGTGVPIGLFLSSAVFSVLHASNPGASLLSTFGILLAGFFLAYAWLRTGQLWLAIGIHIGWNFFQGTVFGFPVSGTGGYHLLRHTVDGPPLITGGAFGPEAGLTGMAAMALGAYLIYLYTRDRAPATVDIDSAKESEAG
jgi:membrane protease YdiL (CAAX protease family)